MACECCRCRLLIDVVGASQAKAKGWIRVIPSKWKVRDLLGWCPECAKKFSVEEEKKQ